MTKSLAQQLAAAYATSEVHAKGASLARLVEISEPKPHWRVLDVATGAGHTAFAFAPHVAKVTATDIDDEMLAETRKFAKANGLANVRTLTAEDPSRDTGSGPDFTLKEGIILARKPR